MDNGSCPCCSFLPNDLFLPRYDGRSNNNALEESVLEDKTDDSEDSPLTPEECWRRLYQQHDATSSNNSNEQRLSSAVLLVDTHGHAHLNGPNATKGIYETTASTLTEIASLTCAVEPSDWTTCLDYAAASPHRMAAIGVHPWYLADLRETWLAELENLLREHPGCMVGEIGLCKMARFVRHYPAGKQAALDLQRHVFTQQMHLAAQYRRPVSIHCVDQHGVLLEIFQELGHHKGALPPAMALHSYSGTANQVDKLLQWEASLSDMVSRPLLFFGFSHSINYVMSSSERSRRQGKETVRRVPPDRLLVESDVHNDHDVVGGTAGAVAFLAWALGEPISVVADRTRRNGLQFLHRLEHHPSQTAQG